MMRAKLYSLLLAVFLWPYFLQAQVTIGSGIQANIGSLLDLKERMPDEANANANRGLLLPRVLLNTATDFDAIIASPTQEEITAHTGLTVYNMGNANLCSGIYVWNGSEWGRLPQPCMIPVNCASAEVNGTYRVGEVMTEANNITLTIEVPKEAAKGTYNFYTDTQNGVSFSATGTLTAGTQQITLQATGSPLSGGVIPVYTLYADFSNSQVSSTTCSVSHTEDSMIPLAKPVIFGFGYYQDVYGYHIESSASKALVISDNNFGTNDNSTVHCDWINEVDIISANLSLLTEANFIKSTTAGLGLNPDIMINGFYSYTTSEVVIDSLIAYLERGGVLILLDEYTVHANSISLRLFNKLFPNSTLTRSLLGGAGSVYAIDSGVNDDITNGPFGDARGKYWGEDASSTVGFLGLPTDSITIYSNGDVLGGSITSSAAPKLNPGYVTMFKHNRLNLFFVGDGGFASNYYTTLNDTYSATTACPFAINSEYRPIPRTGWGTYGPAQGGKFTVHNSLIFANVMYWAIKNAPSNNRK